MGAENGTNPMVISVGDVARFTQRCSGPATEYVYLATHSGTESSHESTPVSASIVHSGGA
jgi:hypothetical protein